MSFSILSHAQELNVAEKSRNFINGEWVDPTSGQYFPHIHPATNETVAQIAETDAAQVDLAVQAARRAFDEGPWSKMQARERQCYLFKIADLLEAHEDELMRMQSLDNGLPIAFANTPLMCGNMAKISSDSFRHYAGWIDKINGQVYPQYSDQAPMQFISMREPVGVVGAILPWNAPILQLPYKVAPALAAGCTVVVKPSELGSLIALRLSEIIAEADLPEGVFNVVTGGASTGDALVSHKGVDKITFTGSKAVGGKVLAASAHDIKRVSLELGGKSAAIVFPDTPSVEMAAHSAMGQVSMFLSGQVCSTTSRALVHQSIYDEFLQCCEDLTKAVKFGDPFDLTVTSSPLVSQTQVQKVMNFIQSGTEQGAKLIVGGDRPDNEELAGGNFVNPTLFANVEETMDIYQEEIFGPVLSVSPFETEEEAIRMANNSKYGLSGEVFSSNVGTAFRVAKALRTGTVGINGFALMPNTPFGGFKQSGLGREGGWSAIEEYTELKTMIINQGV